MSPWLNARPRAAPPRVLPGGTLAAVAAERATLVAILARGSAAPGRPQRWRGGRRPARAARIVGRSKRAARRASRGWRSVAAAGAPMGRPRARRIQAAEARPRSHMWTTKHSEDREIRALNLLIWSQTRCRCAISPMKKLELCYSKRTRRPLRRRPSRCCAERRRASPTRHRAARGGTRAHKICLGKAH